jgi:hypothetical protein
MNWFPVLAAAAVASVPVFGAVNPGRAIVLLLGLAIAILVWMAIEGWKVFKSTPNTLRMR